jgi:hypothetical protein
MENSKAILEKLKLCNLKCNLPIHILPRFQYETWMLGLFGYVRYPKLEKEKYTQEQLQLYDKKLVILHYLYKQNWLNSSDVEVINMINTNEGIESFDKKIIQPIITKNDLETKMNYIYTYINKEIEKNKSANVKEPNLI